jgi:hypothetical protein
MTYPERQNVHFQPEDYDQLGALSLAPRPWVVEWVRLQKHRRVQRLVTKQSFRTHQDTSEKYGRRIAFCAWENLSTCVPGTHAARRYQDLIVPATPDFSTVARMQEKTPAEVFGFPPRLFSEVVEIAVENQKYIPNMGPTAANFLLDLAEVVQMEIKG